MKSKPELPVHVCDFLKKVHEIKTFTLEAQRLFCREKNYSAQQMQEAIQEGIGDGSLIVLEDSTIYSCYEVHRQMGKLFLFNTEEPFTEEEASQHTGLPITVIEAFLQTTYDKRFKAVQKQPDGRWKSYFRFGYIQRMVQNHPVVTSGSYIDTDEFFQSLYEDLAKAVERRKQ